ncbi:MAG TPA: DSD1 family PLP-dependent enzyme [Dehalococcoidia bacterium]|nr:DSD1 family PLP-dependent enzyme [Dehalococcoidia bacterium]
MERPVFQPTGTPVMDLDTPALVVDLDVMDRNIETLHGRFDQSSAKVRPHVTGHQTPKIAHRQLQAANTVGGISVTSVGEAEVFSDAGITDILVSSQIVTRSKIRRLCTLAGSNRIGVAVDNPQNVSDLSQAAEAQGVTLGVLVELDVGLGRCGVAPGDEALELARAVANSPGLRFDGIMAIAPLPSFSSEASDFPERQERDATSWQVLQHVLETRELIEKNSLPVSVVSVGGTHNYDVAAGMAGITEVQAGSYPLMDHLYCRMRPEFSPAAKVLAAVISRPTGESAVLDAGHKATGPDRGLAVLEGVAGAQAVRFSAEHGVLDLQSGPAQNMKSGDKAWLVPFNLGLCFNQYDYVRAVRGDKLEGFWPIAGRGRFD